MYKKKEEKEKYVQKKKEENEKHVPVRFLLLKTGFG
jgi:hypothetical protein